MNFSYLISVIV